MPCILRQPQANFATAKFGFKLLQFLQWRYHVGTKRFDRLMAPIAGARALFLEESWVDESWFVKTRTKAGWLL